MGVRRRSLLLGTLGQWRQSRLPAAARAHQWPLLITSEAAAKAVDRAFKRCRLPWHIDHKLARGSMANNTAVLIPSLLSVVARDEDLATIWWEVLKGELNVCSAALALILTWC